MITGATVGELPVVKEAVPSMLLGYVLLCLYYDNHHGVDEAFPA